MNTLPMHKQADLRRDKFNGPILDREKLREGTYVAMMTAIGSVFLVVAVKALYAIF
ncbi:MAG: hypothetical protein AAGJ68_05000 [Pseudomonadota bacterium]